MMLSKNKVIDKVELRKKFNKWLGDEFDNRNKPSPGCTHRWIFCYNGETDNSLSFDCACCLVTDELEECGCPCHSRIGEIVDFFLEEFEGKSR